MGHLRLFMLVTSFFGFSLSAHASEISCEDTIGMTITSLLESQNSKEVVSGTPISVKHLETTSLYIANSVSEYGATKTTWAVLVKMGPQGTCSVISAVEDQKN